MPVMEAMASGLAVVTTNCLGVTSFAIHGLNCLLVNDHEPDTCARYLVQVLTNSVVR